MTQLNPTLSFNGNAEEAFNFYKSVFGGEFSSPMRWKDNPHCQGWSEADKNLIMHVALPVSGGNVLMASDAPSEFGKKLVEGNNFYIAIIPDTKNEADRLFNGLSSGGKAEMPMQDMFWGAYYGSFTDKFGIQWMINFDNDRK